MDLDDLVHVRGSVRLVSDRAHFVLPYVFDEGEARVVIRVIEHAAYLAAAGKGGGALRVR